MSSFRNPWTTLEQSEVFSCPYFSVRSDAVRHLGGEAITYSSIRVKKHGVAIAPIDLHGCTILVGQYRYVLDRYTWELPGGGQTIDSPSLDAARNELREETGYHAKHWLQVMNIPIAPGTSDELAVGYVAWGLQSGEAQPEPSEDLSWRTLPFSQAVSMAISGGIDNLNGVGLLLALQVRLARGELPHDLAALLKRG